MPKPTRDGPWVPMDCSDIPDAYMSWIPAYAFVFFNTHTIIPLQDIMVSPRPFTRSASITTGPDSRPMSKTTANHAPSVLTPNPYATDPTGFSNSFPYPRNRGTLSLWISSRSYPSLPVTRLSWLLLIVSQNSCFLSRHTTRSCHNNLHNCSFYMSSQSMVSRAMSPQIEGQNSSPIFSVHSEPPWT